MSKECPLGMWRFTDKAIRGMNNLVNKTRTIGIEYGAIIEGNIYTGKLNLGRECTGSECAVELPIKTKQYPYGEFHTHPSGSIKPSPADIRRFDYITENIICIGASQDSQNKISCYHRKFTISGPELAQRRKEVMNEIIQNIKRNRVFTREDRERRDAILEMDFDEFSPEDCKL